jgi:NTE family protein
MKPRLGLVLSGGGLRGVAHIGVLAALAERGLEAECVAATSAGGIVGAFYAAGLPTARMLDFFEHHSPFKISKLSLGKPGLLDAEKIRADFLEFLPEDSFEALGKKLFLTATDLVAAELKIFDSGPLISAILASAAVPMIFTPVEIDGRWYADGGILNNFPVEPLTGLCDVVLGVYASPVRQVERADLDGMLAVSQRAFDVGMFHAAEAKFDRCDVVLCPPALGRFPTFDSKHIHEVYEIGYDAARDRLEEIERALAAVE